MQIKSTTLTSLPKLPKVPAKGKGTITTEPIDFVAPQTVETRLGSIPRDFEVGTGRQRSTRSIPFETDLKEASNRYGKSKDIWRPQPVLAADGTPSMESVSEPLTVEYRNPLAEGLVKGAMGAGLVGFFGFWAGTVATILSGRPEPMVIGGVAGAAVGGLVGGLGAYNDAASESVSLEWQKTDIAEHDLQGYTLRVREDEDCTGTGEDRRCDSDYEHIHRPIIAETKHGEYYKPVVVRTKEST